MVDEKVRAKRIDEKPYQQQIYREWIRIYDMKLLLESTSRIIVLNVR